MFSFTEHGFLLCLRKYNFKNCSRFVGLLYVHITLMKKDNLSDHRQPQSVASWRIPFLASEKLLENIVVVFLRNRCTLIADSDIKLSAFWSDSDKISQNTYGAASDNFRLANTKLFVKSFWNVQNVECNLYLWKRNTLDSWWWIWRTRFICRYKNWKEFSQIFVRF